LVYWGINLIQYSSGASLQPTCAKTSTPADAQYRKAV
jgi:hypothetical protein